MSSATTLSMGQLTPTTWELLTPTIDDDELWPTDQDVAEMALMIYNPPAPLSWDRRMLKRLPSSAKPIKLIGEGAANAVFELDFPPDCPSNSIFKGWLLRVSKAPMNGDTPRFNYLKQQEFYAKRVRYLLRDHLVQQELVVMRGSNVVRKLNNFLASIDHERKAKFRGSYVADTNWGFLVEDMRPQNPSETVLFEFKPKWLLPSPSAPAEAIRCRQCAMELFNFIKDPSSKKALPQTKPCPLILGNHNTPSEISDPFRIAPELRKTCSKADKEYMRDILGNVANHPVIHELRSAQKFADRDGPLFASRGDEKFNFAMTIRDCTCFVQVSTDSKSKEPLKVRLGDFDFKDPFVKFDRWQGAERDLIDRGCYTADWIVCDGTYFHPPTACLLEWSPRRMKEPHIIHAQSKDPSPKVDMERHPSQLPKASKAFVFKADVAGLKTRLASCRKGVSDADGFCPLRIEP